MSTAPAAQEGWWMRPCWHCLGKHMDAMCPSNRPAGQPRVPAVGTTLRPATTPKGAGRSTSMPKG
eukprot:2914606-Heterocapsa_arctica.AAC.1